MQLFLPELAVKVTFVLSHYLGVYSRTMQLLSSPVKHCCNSVGVKLLKSGALYGSKDCIWFMTFCVATICPALAQSSSSSSLREVISRCHGFEVKEAGYHQQEYGMVWSLRESGFLMNISSSIGASASTLKSLAVSLMVLVFDNNCLQESRLTFSIRFL